MPLPETTQTNLEDDERIRGKNQSANYSYCEELDSIPIDEQEGDEVSVQILPDKPKIEAEHEFEYAVPENFSMVMPAVYRSSFPRPDHYPFLKKLHLKGILTLISEPYPDDNTAFANENGIKIFQVGMSGNKEPFVNVSDETITTALKIIIDPKNHPLLIHCNRGKHRTGCLVGCLRKLQNWSLTMIFDEYRRFAYPKARALDQQLIELYDEDAILCPKLFAQKQKLQRKQSWEQEEEEEDMNINKQ